MLNIKRTFATVAIFVALVAPTVTAGDLHPLISGAAVTALDGCANNVACPD